MEDDGLWGIVLEIKNKECQCILDIDILLCT